MSDSNQPTASRPGGGYFRSSPLLAWSWAESRLISARSYWVSSTLPDGRPHTRAVWAVWLQGKLMFSTGSRIGTNLRERPHVSVNLESGDEVVILEGTAEFTSDRETLRAFLDVYNPKYNWDFTVENVGEIVVVTPHLAFGWVNDGTGLDHGAVFNATGTRWRFA